MTGPHCTGILPSSQMALVSEGINVALVCGSYCVRALMLRLGLEEKLLNSTTLDWWILKASYMPARASPIPIRLMLLC